MLNYWLWVTALTLLLLYPVSKLIWVFSVRRLQRKLKRELDQAEITGQMRRGWIIGAIISFAFSALYNFNTLNMSGNG
ncbi:MAG: hypothetical protein OEU36_05940 [Gammaproteobacteria bacterium]|nr:hypothetical protein [Gammaproteobacteria bacterium]